MIRHETLSPPEDIYPINAWKFTETQFYPRFLAQTETIFNVTDSKIIKLYVDDEPFYLPTANRRSFERTLDMQAGTLDREVLWETPAGKQVLIQSRRLVSLQHRHLAAIA